MRRFALALILVWGCDHGNDPHGPDDKEKPRTSQVTVWSDRFEIFVEHPPIIAGTPVTPAIHVTDLRTFEPRREGRLILKATGGPDAALEHTEESPKSQGIYAPFLTFPKAGTWKVSITLDETRVDLPPLQVHVSAADARPPESPEGIAFLKEQQWKLGTRTAPVGRRRLVERLRVPGQVTARPGSRATVTPPVEGRLAAPPGRALPSLGDTVEAGQVLAVVQPPFSELSAKAIEASAEAARAKLAMDQAELAYTRVKKLHEAQAKTDRDLQEADFAQRSAKAHLESALAVQAAYRKAGAVELIAPLSGTVVVLQASLGEHVGPEHPVLVILDPDRVHLEARIPESEVPRVASARGAAYETSDARGRYVPVPGGRAVHLGLEVDATSRTVPLLYEVPNPGRSLRIGMTLTLYVETAQAEDAVAIPESALVDEEGRYVAFVQVAGETFQKRDLVLGARDTGFVQVVRGLSEGERLVTHGAYAIRLASVSTSLPAHGHAH
jgi:RND family efflux transporter MFP subunit